MIGGKIALIDTAHERARFYAKREDLKTGKFLYAPMTAPFSPEKYRAMVSEGASAVGEDGVVIVDCFSHAWSSDGGVLDLKDKIAAQPNRNSYTAGAEAEKAKNSLVNGILSAYCHTIVTMRLKMKYILKENEKGRLEPQKIRLAPVQRDDTEYEFDIVLDIGRNHVATASKDTTFLDMYGCVVTPELGEQLRVWLC